MQPMSALHCQWVWRANVTEAQQESCPAIAGSPPPGLESLGYVVRFGAWLKLAFPGSLTWFLGHNEKLPP